jgi:hypothetical protein
MMNAAALLTRLQHAGYAVSVVDSHLRVAPASRLTSALRAAVRTHKAGLMMLLTNRADVPALSVNAPPARCPFCHAQAGRREVWRYELVKDEHGQPHSAPCLIREIACAVCAEATDTTFHFDDDLLMEVEERAAIMHYMGGLSRSEAERLARSEVLGLLASTSQADISPRKRY